MDSFDWEGSVAALIWKFTDNTITLYFLLVPFFSVCLSAAFFSPTIDSTEQFPFHSHTSDTRASHTAEPLHRLGFNVMQINFYIGVLKGFLIFYEMNIFALWTAQIDIKTTKLFTSDTWELRLVLFVVLLSVAIEMIGPTRTLYWVYIFIEVYVNTHGER